MRLAKLLACAAALVGTSALAQPEPSPPPTAQASGLIGPALFVSDLQRSLRFYVGGLGMKIGMQMGPATRRETILTFGGDPRSPGIILLTDSSATPPRPIELGHGYDRTVLRIGDLAGVESRLKATGFVTTPIRDVAMGYRMMLVTDPDGYRYELVQTAKH